MLERIEIKTKFSFEELCDRLRKVQLRGFPDICVYEDASFMIEDYSPINIVKDIFTPQPSVYQTHLDKIERLNGLFLNEGVNIFDLTGGYDFIGFDEEGEKEWTIIPPVVERFFVPIKDAYLDYSRFLGNDLKQRLNEEGVTLTNLYVDNYKIDFDGWNICDGSHRIHFAILNAINQCLLSIDDIKEGWPYYAVPQPYSKIHVEPERIEDKLDKIHILPEPCHKWLYRLFPSGGILSGTIRSVDRGN